jgi:choloylglycine hydrolase
MAAVTEGYPLYAESMNEAGLYMAGLRFAESARYASVSEFSSEGKHALAPWELIPYLLGQCATVSEVRDALGEIRVVNRPFSQDLPAAPLHWHIADANPTHEELVLEITSQGMTIFENCVGVLTNEPPFPSQTAHLSQFSYLKRDGGDTLGSGGRGLPGDYTSPSRFVRAATLRRWAVAHVEKEGDGNEVNCFFRILEAVSPMAGAVLTPEGTAHRTLYTCCMDGRAGIYHYFTEADRTLRSVSFDEAEFNGKGLGIQ